MWESSTVIYQKCRLNNTDSTKNLNYNPELWNVALSGSLVEDARGDAGVERCWHRVVGLMLKYSMIEIHLSITYINHGSLNKK